jgi:drug/metabolite transporter (DMT)-like permease
MNSAQRPSTIRILLGYAAIYFIWGSTFLGIRIGVHEVPPFLFAAIRFSLAGIILYVWMRVKGTRSPTRREWVSASAVGLLIFVFDYGLLFWAEQRVPSGIAAVMMATIPVFMALSEIVFLGTQKLTLRLALALLVGSGGVVVLVSRSLSLSEAPVDTAGAIALVIAAISWALAAVLMRKLPLPPVKSMSSAAQMLAGGALLFVASCALGEFRAFHPQQVSRGAWIALAYLIFAGSIVAFTAYVWLLHYESPTRVGTYAYINPIVAVAIGYFLGGEAVGPRTLLGTLLVLLSVIVITTTPAKRPATAWREKDPQLADQDVCPRREPASDAQ